MRITDLYPNHLKMQQAVWVYVKTYNKLIRLVRHLTGGVILECKKKTFLANKAGIKEAILVTEKLSGV
jgi:hypothetical protein